MRRSPEFNEHGAAAELALKAHALAFNSEITADMTDGAATLREIANTVDLTEAPEDAVASLVIDLMCYCEREEIDWSEDVMSRALQYVRDHSDNKLSKR